MEKMGLDPDWTAPKLGHDWSDKNVQKAVDWFQSFVPAADMSARLARAKAYLLAARERWLEGHSAATHDRSDMAAWQMLQGATFAVGRYYWTPDDSVKIVPYLTRIGMQLDLVRKIPGAEERAERLMNEGRSQPEAGIYELLVAQAWRRHGWTVEFVPESKTHSTPDLRVQKGNRHWSIECKRFMDARYTTLEREKGRLLANPIHRLSEKMAQPLFMRVIYKVELSSIPEDYLESRLSQVADITHAAWSDEIAMVSVRPPNWPLIRRVMNVDDVFYGSSRMIELFAGEYSHAADHSFSGRWRPSEKHIFHAETLYHGSLVSWFSDSRAAKEHKARHFRRILFSGEKQLDRDKPGVIHIGVETMDGGKVDAIRHTRNLIESYLYEPQNPRLRWVYGNYFVPELTTNPNETWAMNETMVPYKIGRHKTAWPLPDHLLITPEEESHSGYHWT